MPRTDTFENTLTTNATLAKLGVLLALWIIAFYPVYPSLISTWLNHSDNSQGILVPFISLYFIWQKREQLASAEVSSSGWGLAILILSLLCYIVSYAGAIAVISRAMIVFSLVGLVLFTLGSEIFSLLAFPLLFLIFMVQLPLQNPLPRIF